MNERVTRIESLDGSQNEQLDRAEDILGAIVPLRAREAPGLSEASDLSNVVPFARRRPGPERRAPAIAVADQDRPAPHVLGRDRRHHLAMLAGASLAVHASLFAAFNREPPPLASIGEISISAELVLGTDRAAGRERTPSESEITSAAVPKLDEPVAQQPEIPRKAETAQESAAPAPADMMAATPPQPEGELPPPPDQPVKDIEKPALAADTTAKHEDRKPEPKPVKDAKRAAEDGKSERKRSAPASVASVASNSIGYGRSDAQTNYRGLVAAHLARYKQFPADARGRGDQGTATVTFSLDGRGNVTSVRIARSSGSASLDRETQAMVHRASPFPAPPLGRGTSFTVPISFHLR